MTPPQIPSTHLDLLDKGTAVLATNGPDGRPQLSAVWFLRVGDDVRISLNTSRQKVKNLRRDPAITFFILDLEAPTRYLEIRGDALIAEDPGYAFADLVGAKYGADLRSFDGDHLERVVVSIDASRVNAVDMAAGH
jgi:PPOX class probable F420-dependent enzyme